MDELRPRLCVHREYRVQYRAPVQVAAGEKVSVGRDDDEHPGWKWCKASNGREGWIPAELLSQEGGEAIVLQEYSAQELAVERGEEVEVEMSATVGYWFGTREAIWVGSPLPMCACNLWRCKAPLV